MADTRKTKIETDRQELSMDEMTPSEMHQIVGGRCWDGPLGERDGCPPKPSVGAGGLSYMNVHTLPN